MLINENNKNTVLKGMVKRGLNQDPNELKEKLYTMNNQNTEKKQKEKIVDIQKNIRDTFNKLRNLKWKSPLFLLVH